MAGFEYPGMVIPYTDGVNFGCYVCPVPPQDYYEEPSRRVRKNEAKKVKAKKMDDPRSFASTIPKTPFSNPAKVKKESPQETGLNNAKTSTDKSSSETLEKRPSKVKASVGRLVSCFSRPRVEGEEA